MYIAFLDQNRPKKKKQSVAGQGTYMIIPYNFLLIDTMIWVLDTESPIHIYNSSQGLQVTSRFREGERFLNVGDGRLVLVLTLGIIKLVFESQYIVLNESHYCHSFFLNIIFVGFLAMFNYEISIKKNFCDIILNGVTILRG